MSSNKFNQMADKWKNQSTKIDKYWTGTFQEYLELIKKNPKITRNAFQRMYDMILSQGTSRYEDAKKEIVRYHFFDDKENNGVDAVFGLDIQLMKFVNVLKAAAQGYGPEKRVILLHGPVGSAKSTICRRLKKGLEAYSRKDEGDLYTFEWVDPDKALTGLFGKDLLELYHLP